VTVNVYVSGAPVFTVLGPAFVIARLGGGALTLVILLAMAAWPGVLGGVSLVTDTLFVCGPGCVELGTV
jgi:hypothetical protein